MKELFRLDGKTALVVGGAGGIGQKLAEGLACFGAKVIISSRKDESLKKAAAEIKEACGADVAWYTCDAVDEASVTAMADKINAEIGKVDVLVCSQGFNKKYPAVEFPMDIWDEMFATNVKSVMICNKVFGGRMKENGYGKIVNVSSVRSIIATHMLGNAGYTATKGAVNMITRTLASELGPEVTVNAIAPTVVETPMMKGFLDKDPGAREKLGGMVPIQRMEIPEDCVGPVIFLASEASSYTTGQIIFNDGGLTSVVG